MPSMQFWLALAHGAFLPSPRMKLGHPAPPPNAAIGPSVGRAASAAVGCGVRRAALRSAWMAEDYRAKIAELLQRTGRVSPSVRSAASAWLTMSSAVAIGGATTDFAAAGGYPSSAEIRAKIEGAAPVLEELLIVCGRLAPALVADEEACLPLARLAAWVPKERWVRPLSEWKGPEGDTGGEGMPEGHTGEEGVLGVGDADGESDARKEVHTGGEGDIVGEGDINWEDTDGEDDSDEDDDTDGGDDGDEEEDTAGGPVSGPSADACLRSLMAHLLERWDTPLVLHGALAFQGDGRSSQVRNQNLETDHKNRTRKRITRTQHEHRSQDITEIDHKDTTRMLVN
jgi:hypothetical protein